MVIICVPRKEGGGSLKQVEGAYTVKVTKLMEYMESAKYPLICTYIIVIIALRLFVGSWPLFQFTDLKHGW
jgi:hypothetical protein